MAAPEFKIEKGLPIPEKRTAPKYIGLVDAIRRMEVGDSMTLPVVNKWNPNCNIRTAAKIARVKVTVRVIGNEVRFWRIA